MYLYSSGQFIINSLKEIDDLGLNLWFARKYLVYNPETKKARVDIITPFSNVEPSKFRCGNKYKLLVFEKRVDRDMVSVFHEFEPFIEEQILFIQNRCIMNGIAFIYGSTGVYHTGDLSRDQEFRLWENYMSQQGG